jgi:hypothetical protein
MALTALALAGCGASPGNSAAAASAETSSNASATATPTPTEMTVVEAGKVYLAAVCPTNILQTAAVKTAQTVPLDLAAAKKDVAALRDSYRKTIESLSDPKVLWPAAVKADVATVADGMYTDLSGAENVANQTTVSNFNGAWNAWGDAQSKTLTATAQKVRLKLGLPSDTSSSCAPK